MPATDMRMMKSKIATRGLVIPERIGEAVEDGVEATVTWPRRLTKKPATWRLLESIGLL